MISLFHIAVVILMICHQIYTKMFHRLMNSTTLKVSRTFQNVRSMSEYTGPIENCLNKVQLLGRVGADPVFVDNDRYRFCTFDLATNIRYPKRGPDNRVDYVTKTEWHKVKVFRPNLVERVEKTVKKGTRLIVHGALEYYPVEVANGEPVLYAKIASADIIVMAGSKDS